MTAHALLLLAGLVLLAGGGELLVRGASNLARAAGVSPLVIGLTIVAFGTSAPELAVSLLAAAEGSTDLAIGNVVGSNIFNVLVILGLSALVVPLFVSEQLVRVEVPLMIGISALTAGLSADGAIGALDALVLLAVLGGYGVWLFRIRPADDPPEDGATTGSLPWSLPAVAGGIALLVLGARWLVSGAVSIAEGLGVSEVIIGLTIVAAGTSLPEVATSVVAAVRGQRDIAIGNVVGSNICNLSIILGLTALVVGPLPVTPAMLGFDMVVMTAVALACLPVFFTGYVIARWEGLLFLAYYVVYTVYLVLDATEHTLLPDYRNALVLFALPLTAVTLAVLATRAFHRQRT